MTKPKRRSTVEAWQLRKLWLSNIGIHIFAMVAILGTSAVVSAFDGEPIRLIQLLLAGLYAAAIGIGVSRWETQRFMAHQQYRKSSSLRIAEAASDEFAAQLADYERSLKR